MIYHISEENNKPTSVTVIFSDTFVADASHPNFFNILDACEGDDVSEEEIRELFDVGVAVTNKFQALSNRASVKDGKIYFDKEEVSNAITEKIFEQLKDQKSFIGTVNFLEKIWDNPIAHAKEHLFRWLDNRSFVICDDGDFLAYKGVQLDGRSLTAGKAIVNGEEIVGRIPNPIGAIIEMPRNAVRFAPDAACSEGLHVGTKSFAKGFGPRLLEVKVNPRDVVNVPSDHNSQKMRVCKYKVVRIYHESYLI